MSVKGGTVVMGTAGHIDHGKTALVRALTGTDPDRLPEEKRRGITIDLGFASLSLPGIEISFVDVPGHHAFLRNMLAGAGGIDAVLLAVSAEEGVKPQTEEHLAICQLLGLRSGVAVLTKADAVGPERLAAARAELRRFLRGSFLEDAPMIATSARTGQGLDELRSHLAGLTLPGRDRLAPARLPIDRAFTLRGFGTVVTGTLHAGTLRKGDALALKPGSMGAPGSIGARVRGLQSHGQPVEEAHAGTRVAVNLAGIEVGALHRGQTLAAAGLPEAALTVDVEVEMLPGAPPLRHRAQVRLHAFAAEAMATVALYGPLDETTAPGAGSAGIEAGQTGLARLRLHSPILLVPGDRFVLRQPSPAATVGGGRVLDASPLAGQKKAKTRAWLEALAGAEPGRQIELRTGRRGTAGLALARAAAETGRTPAAVLALAPATLLRLAGDHLLTEEAAADAAGLVLRALKGAPEGRKRAELRTRTRLADPVFSFTVERLLGERQVEANVEGNGETLRLYGAGSELDHAAQRRLLAIAADYATAGLAAPAVADVAARHRVPEAEMRRLMTLLLREKTLVKLGQGDLYMHRRALEELCAAIRKLRGQRLDVNRFKELTGLSRKYAIPLLEHLDQQRVTRREGETRRVL